MKMFAVIAFFSLSAVATACAGNAGQEPPEASSDEALTSTQRAQLLGTFTVAANATDDLLFYTITLKGNGSYVATGGCRPGPTGPHCFAITRMSGKWTAQKSGPQLGAPLGVQQLVLTDSFNQKDAYYYSFSGDKLSLSTVFRGKQSVFTRQDKQLRFYQICADDKGNSLGACPEDMGCEFDGPSGNIQRCLPPI